MTEISGPHGEQSDHGGQAFQTPDGRNPEIKEVVPSNSPTASRSTPDVVFTTPSEPDALQSAAILRALAHPDADISPGLRQQFKEAEAIEVATERLSNPDVPPEERAALESVKSGAQRKFSSHRPPRRGRNALIVGATALTVAGYTGYRAADNALSIPALQLQRGVSEVPVEIKETHVPWLDIDVPLPSVDLAGRDNRVQAAQERLDAAKTDAKTNAIIAGGALVAGAIAEAVIWSGAAPVKRAQRIIGSEQERGGWRRLNKPGQTPEGYRKRYNQRRQSGHRE